MITHDTHCDSNGCLFPNCQCEQPPEYKPEDNWKITKFLLVVIVLLLIVLSFSCSQKTFYTSSIHHRDSVVLTVKQTLSKLQGINTIEDYDKKLRGYKWIVVYDMDTTTKYSVKEFRKILFAKVHHRPRYNHWAKPYKMYAPVKAHKPQ
jgi:hypothetical protein